MWPKRTRSGSPPEAPPPAEIDSIGVEFGWQTHQALQQWTASVDVKSSIVVVVETAVAGAAAHALIVDGGALHNSTGLHLFVAIVAVALLIASVICALWVVFPRLERLRTARLANGGLIYFGHLRQRETDDIAYALAALTPAEQRRQLAEQLRITADVAWRKHAWLQHSLKCFGAGALVLVLAYSAFGSGRAPRQLCSQRPVARGTAPTAIRPDPTVRSTAEQATNEFVLSN